MMKKETFQLVAFTYKIYDNLLLFSPSLPFFLPSDSKASTPPAAQASIDILQSSVHYVSIPNLPLQLCILDCISLCLFALRHRESMSHDNDITYTVVLTCTLYVL